MRAHGRDPFRPEVGARGSPRSLRSRRPGRRVRGRRSVGRGDTGAGSPASLTLAARSRPRRIAFPAPGGSPAADHPHHHPAGRGRRARHPGLDVVRVRPGAGGGRVEFERRLLRIASTAASQITPDLVREVRRLGDGTGAYSSIDVQLVTLRSATGIEDASLVDSTGIACWSTPPPPDLEEGLTSALDSLAGPAFRRALRRPCRALGRVPPRRPATACGLRPGPQARRRHRRDRGGGRGALRRGARRARADARARAAAERDRGTAVLATLIFRQAASAARLERRLSRARTCAAMGRLTATLAHEIKNPLAIIRGSAERLLELEPESRRMARLRHRGGRPAVEHRLALPGVRARDDGQRRDRRRRGGARRDARAARGRVQRATRGGRCAARRRAGPATGRARQRVA